MISAPTLAAAESSVIQDQTSFGWLNQYSLNNFIPESDDWGSCACVPTSAVNGMTFLQNEYGFYFNDLLTGSTYADWQAATVLLGRDFMGTSVIAGTLPQTGYYGLEDFLLQEKEFDLVRLEAMVPDSIWNLETATRPEPSNKVNERPSLDFIEASLAAGNPTMIMFLYEADISGGGHGVLASGLIRHADGTATLKLVDPLDPSLTYPDGYPGGDAKFSDAIVRVVTDASGTEVLLMDYKQYSGDLPYDEQEYVENTDSYMVAAISIDTSSVQDYLRGVALAPSYFGQLPELALQNQSAIRDQLWRRTALGLSQSPVGSVDVWASAGGGRTKITGISGSPDTLALGLEWRKTEQALLGVALHYSNTKPDWNQAGYFHQKDYNLNLYGGYQQGRWSLAGTVSLGSQDNDLTRRFQTGENWRTHWSSTEGTSLSVGAELAYVLQRGALSHSPFAQLSAQRIVVDGFTERAQDNQTSTTLQVGRQTRNALTGSLGWRAFWQQGQWMPYASLAVNRDFNAKSQDLHLTSWAGSELALLGNKPRETYGSLNLGLIGQLADGVSMGLDLHLTQNVNKSNDTRAMATLSFSLSL
ncbi:autotransporter outer membrane beta-barrel domain-containing protein [Akkermansiaceae bacterium]|nr:autotransporter outer membrane beta-barrel domain-containing protein [Akkermansiaceae bacterium]